MGVISGTEAKHVEARDGGDGVKVLQRFGRLDLEDDKLFVQAVGNVLLERDGAKFSIGVSAVDRATANRLETGPLHNFPRFGRRGDMWHQNAGGIRLERSDVVAVA